MNHETICHRWANQIPNGRSKELEAKGASVFYIGPTIYSYGHHYPMGHLYGDTAYINTQGYSNSTSKHIGHTRRAINPSTHPNEYCLNDTRLMERIIYATKLEDKTERDNLILSIKIENEKLDIPGAMREFKKRTKGLKLNRYRQALGCLNAVRKLQGKKTLLENPERIARFEADFEKSRVKSVKAAKIRVAAEKLRTLKDHLKDSLRFQDPANKNGVYYSQYEPISLRVDGGRVHTSNYSAVSIEEAKFLLQMWKTALINRRSFSKKTMRAGDYQGVCIRRNGTVKIGCTRILPDAVRKLSFELQGV